MTKQPMIKGYWVPLYYAISTHCFGSMTAKFPTVFTSCSIQKETQINQIFYTNNVLQRSHFNFLSDTLYFPAHKYSTGCTQCSLSHEQGHTQLSGPLGNVLDMVAGNDVIKKYLTALLFLPLFLCWSTEVVTWILLQIKS